MHVLTCALVLKVNLQFISILLLISIQEQLANSGKQSAASAIGTGGAGTAGFLTIGVGGAMFVYKSKSPGRIYYFTVIYTVT